MGLENRDLSDFEKRLANPGASAVSSLGFAPGPISESAHPGLPSRMDGSEEDFG
jgi:hypothetical protein